MLMLGNNIIEHITIMPKNNRLFYLCLVKLFWGSRWGFINFSISKILVP